MSAVKAKTVYNLTLKMRRAGLEIAVARSSIPAIHVRRYKKPTSKNIARISRMMVSGDLKLVGCTFGKTWMAIYLQPQNKRLA